MSGKVALIGGITPARKLLTSRCGTGPEVRQAFRPDAGGTGPEVRQAFRPDAGGTVRIGRADRSQAESLTYFGRTGLV